MKYDVVIKNGTIVTAAETIEADVAIKDGVITKVAPSLHVDTLGEIDAEGLHVLPGVIDSHVHFNEPGRADWEGIKTGSESLARGGATTFFDMPLNSTPPVVDKESLLEKQHIAKEKSVVDFRLWGGLVPENIDHLKELHQNGVIGFKAFMSPSGIDDFNHADDATLYNGMKVIHSLGSLLAVHAESTVICEGLAAEKQLKGQTSACDFMEARPTISEIEAVRRVISFAEATGCKLHIVHASSRKVVQVIEAAKKRGVDVTVETCPHYLSLTVEDLEELGGVAKCMPPLRDQHEIDELWEAVKQGEIDTIGSDHSPAPTDMKTITTNYFEGWGGISGAQNLLNVMLTEGYFKRDIPLEKIVELTATNPATIFSLPTKGTIAAGYDADVTLVDLNERFELKEEDLLYKHQHSPYTGKTFIGQVKQTLSAGEVIYQNR